jgi:hypothetical protein
MCLLYYKLIGQDHDNNKQQESDYEVEIFISTFPKTLKDYN